MNEILIHTHNQFAKQFVASESSKCITRDRENRDKGRPNEENVKVLTCSAVDIAVNKIEQSFQYALDFYY